MMRICRECNRPSRNFIKGMCNKCYCRDYCARTRIRAPKSCGDCNKPGRPFARGRCKQCYHTALNVKRKTGYWPILCRRLPASTLPKKPYVTPKMPSITIHEIIGAATPKTVRAVNKILSGQAIFAGVPV